MEIPIDALKEKLRFLKEMTKQTHITFRRYEKAIPMYEKAIGILKDAETSEKQALTIQRVSKQRKLFICSFCKSDQTFLSEGGYVGTCLECDKTARVNQ